MPVYPDPTGDIRAAAEGSVVSDPQLDLFATRGMVRSTDLDTATTSGAVPALHAVQRNRLLVLQLSFEHGPITMFCPFVLMGSDSRYKQTAIGPRFKRLRLEGLIEQVEDRVPRAGAETSKAVSAYQITSKGRDYLRANWPEVTS